MSGPREHACHPSTFRAIVVRQRSESRPTMRFFNTEGPIKPEKHYCIPALERLDIDEVLRLVRDEKYFVLHAPRQTGKTSVLIALQDLLSGQGYHCLYATVEGASTAGQDLERAIGTVLANLAFEARSELDDPFLSNTWRGILADSVPDHALMEALARWSRASPKPLVLLIDEIDALQVGSLLSVLRQLRAGYPKRPGGFPQSVVLCGMRDVRDCRIDPTVSPFNIVAKSLRLRDFSREETLALLGQHTAETGQAFTAEAQEAVWEQTLGQPWLVNALARETCFESEAGRDRSRAVTDSEIADARERLILSRVTHLDQLAYRLEEERVRQVIEPILAGGDESAVADRDIEYARDLGLLAKDGPLRIANPVYAEVIPRELTWKAQAALRQGLVRRRRRRPRRGEWRRSRRSSARITGRTASRTRRLGLSFCCRRFCNGCSTAAGGREFGLGRGRVDLLIVWPKGGSEQKFVVECKMLRGSLEATVAAGLEQVAGYMDRCAAETGHLVIFDRDEKKPWSEKVFRRTESNVEIWGM